MFALGACKQGEGERCQIPADCEEGLVCAGDGFCRSEIPSADAAPEPDDRIIITVDATPGDPDATPATPDATPATPDAAP